MSYYIVIPAPVRHADIPDGAKLLFGDIAGLCKREGYCYASNDHLADIAGTSRRTAENYLAALDEAGFIRREIGPGNDRKIYLTQKSAHKDANIGGARHAESCDKLIHSSTITDTIGDLAFNEVTSYFDEWGFTAAESERLARGFIDYNADGKQKDWKRRAATWKNRAIDYGEVRNHGEAKEEHEIRDEQLGTIDTSKWKKTSRGYFLR